MDYVLLKVNKCQVTGRMSKTIYRFNIIKRGDNRTFVLSN